MQAYRRRRKPLLNPSIQISSVDLEIIKRLKETPEGDKRAVALEILESDAELRLIYNKWCVIQQMGSMLREIGLM